MHTFTVKKPRKPTTSAVTKMLVLQVILIVAYLLWVRATSTVEEPTEPPTPIPVREAKRLQGNLYQRTIEWHSKQSKRRDLRESLYGEWIWVVNEDRDGAKSAKDYYDGNKVCASGGETYSDSELNGSKLPERAKIVNKIIEEAKLTSTSKVFEVGYACGAWDNDLKKALPGISIGGIDFSTHHYDFVTETHPDGDWYLGDMRLLGKIVKKREYFDMVFTWGVIQLVNHPEEVCEIARDMYDMVKPGGTMWIGLNEEIENCRTSDYYWGWILLPDQFWEHCFRDIDENVVVKYHFETEYFGLTEPVYCTDTDTILITKPMRKQV